MRFFLLYPTQTPGVLRQEELKVATTGFLDRYGVTSESLARVPGIKLYQPLSGYNQDLSLLVINDGLDRISPQRVVDAFRAIGFAPDQMNWAEPQWGRCCGLSAVCQYEQGRFPAGHDSASRLLGLSIQYAMGFTYGYDGYELENEYEYSSDFLLGYQDGQAALVGLIRRGHGLINRVQNPVSEPEPVAKEPEAPLHLYVFRPSLLWPEARGVVLIAARSYEHAQELREAYNQKAPENCHIPPLLSPDNSDKYEVFVLDHSWPLDPARNPKPGVALVDFTP